MHHRKTRLALDYAIRRFDSKKCSVFWIHANTEASFVNDVKIIARKARIVSPSDDAELLLAVREWIEDQPAWVMVIDGADDVELFTQDRKGHLQLRDFALEGHNGTVIYTSQDRKILDHVGWARGLEVGSMTPEEAVSFLQITANHGKSFGNSEAALQLAQELNLNPLVISHVTTWMRAQSTQPQDMLPRLAQSRQRDAILSAPRMDLNRPQDEQRSIFDILSNQAKLLACSDKAAHRIIAIIAYLDRHLIPLDLFLVTGLDKQNDAARKAIARLKDLSLIHDNSTATDGPSYRIDNLVQEAILRHLDNPYANVGQQDQVTPTSPKCFRGEAISLLSSRFPRRIYYDTLVICEPLVKHALKATQEMPRGQAALTETGELMSAVGHYLHFCGRWREMEVPFRRALEAWQKCLEPHDIRITAATDSLAWAHLKLGDHGQALELFLSARKIRVEGMKLQETHTDVLTSDMNIAVTYREQDRLDMARPMLERVFDLHKQLLGDEHPDSVQSMIEMAELYGRGTQSRKAVKLVGKALNLQSRHLGQDDPKTMQTKSYLGFFQGVHEKYPQAEKTLTEVLDLQKQKLGKTHPHTLESKALLGWVQFKRDDMDNAFDNLNKAIRGYEDVLGESHPKTKEALLMLADVYFVLGKYSNAADIQEGVLNDNCRRLGKTHRDSLLVQMDLARTYHALGQERESRKLGRAAYDALSEKYGEADADSLKAAEQLAIINGAEEAA
jgi:tetratricopeptide (TPR) repeat protein